MTHEYVIATNGLVHAADPGAPGARPTALAWAADHVLAVGTDDAVRSISRGDSTFLDLGGCTVTALPDDPAAAEALVSGKLHAPGVTPGDVDIGALLIEAGMLEPYAALELGSPADLAFWGAGPEGTAGHDPPIRLLAVVRSGAFSEGDEHRGPFPPARARGDHPPA